MYKSLIVFIFAFFFAVNAFPAPTEGNTTSSAPDTTNTSVKLKVSPDPMLKGPDTRSLPKSKDNGAKDIVGSLNTTVAPPIIATTGIATPLASLQTNKPVNVTNSAPLNQHNCEELLDRKLPIWAMLLGVGFFSILLGFLIGAYCVYYCCQNKREAQAKAEIGNHVEQGSLNIKSGRQLINEIQTKFRSGRKVPSAFKETSKVITVPLSPQFPQDSPTSVQTHSMEVQSVSHHEAAEPLVEKATSSKAPDHIEDQD